MRYLADHTIFVTGRTPATCLLDPSSVSPKTLIASRNLAEDPRLSKKGYSDKIEDVLPPSDRFDLVGISRYSRYVSNVVRQLHDSVKPEPVKSVKTDSVTTDPVTTE